MYDTLKALHIIFIVTWFAGLFYIVRLFVYQVEAREKPAPENQILGKQFKLMAKRLWFGITWPSLILSFIFGPWLLIENPNLLKAPFMHIKLTFVFGLLLYHIYCHVIFKKLQREEGSYTSNFLRIWNEVATLFLVAIVFLIVLKSSLNWVYGVVGFVLFGVLLMLAIRIYKKIRTAK
ncbi:MAG: CopD family protein [Crocinitomicaceae bacterium]|nr:CopD family protein [Crocinitomicaceae bacterium]